MKNEKIKNKVEDILTDDLRLTEVREDVAGSVRGEDTNYSLAVRIYRALLNSRNFLMPKQKQLLGDQIQQSIQSYKRKMFIRRFSAAAMFLLFISVSYLYLSDRESGIKLYAQDYELPTNGSTRLYLSGEQTVDINSEESVIDYSENGNLIEIDASETVNQAVDHKEMVVNTVVVPYGKRTKITLSDQTSVWLNSGSKLVFPARFENQDREVYLEGEAMFEVTHDRRHPFHVLTNEVDVTVLGTVFNVSAYRDDSLTSTVLVEGSVELSYEGHSLIGKSKELMQPGTMASYDVSAKRMKQQEVETELYTSWRNGYLVFRQQPLPDILKKVSRYYNVNIKLDDPELVHETFSGSLDLRNSAFEILTIVAEIVNAQAQQQDDQIVITRI
ncbi:FecR family protein [Mangrovibacterium lignilyticum]|uniref:FecR family protein n=1 Tax=Mangrovibacterium lignilyticum TaxID=2668052 RepID=UPI0013D5322F|nr:FecR domain-containing protein [Mangrovibacterium lignilyticum]